MMGEWNVQKLRPIPKKPKSKLGVSDFRGISISNVTRALCSSALLYALETYLTVHCPLSFAYASNKSADALQMCLSHATRIMSKWYGEVAVVKLDVRAAFDAVPWSELYKALLANGVPSALASAILQLQQSGFVLEWAGERSAFVFQPTT
eukprot:3738454-Amphidinium_carterae.1